MSCDIGRLKNSCKFPGCSNSYYANIVDPLYKNKHFYWWPKCAETARLWCAICKFDMNGKYGHFSLCEDHFADVDFVNESRHRLRRGAVPRGNEALSIDEGSRKEDEDFDNTHMNTGAVVIDEPIILETHPFCSEDLINSNGASPVTLSNNNPTRESSHTEHAYCKNPEYRTNKPGILTKISLSKKNLTPRKQLMLTAHNNLLSQVSKLKKNLLQSKNSIKELKHNIDIGEFDELDIDLNNVTKNFIKSQIVNANKAPSGREWSVEDKSFALSLYKRSPKLYRYLQSQFLLPSTRTLKKVLSGIPYETGVNQYLLKNLQNKLSSMSEDDKYVALEFDAIALDTLLQYEPHKQVITGYKDMAHLGRFNEIANEALVFLIRGLRTNFKSTVAYYFITKSTTCMYIKDIIKKVIVELMAHNIIVMVTVCDQESTNRAALDSLCADVPINERTNYHFVVGGRTIFIIFDVPHLLKNTRNCLVQNKIYFHDRKYATMAHIETAFELDQSNRIYRRLSHLHKHYFNFKDTFMKMKVHIAAKQLSHSVAGAIEAAVALNECPSECIHTAEFVALIDKLFDSLNGYSDLDKESKPFRTLLRDTSPHLGFWEDLLPQMANWRIVNIESNKDVTNRFSFLNGWQITMRSVRALWIELKKLDFKCLSLRALNQDNLENLFCQVRQHGICNVNPSCYQFVAALKTISVNSMSVPLGRNSNCENDESTTWLANLQECIALSATDSPTMEPADWDEFDTFDCLLDDIHENQASAYVAGYLLKEINITKANCSTCLGKYLSAEVNHKHVFVTTKEYCDNKSSLLYASEELISLVQTLHTYLYEYLDKHGHERLIETNFKRSFSSIAKKFTFCDEHDTMYKEQFINKCLRLTIFKYVKERKQTGREARASKQKFSKKIKKFSGQQCSSST